MGDDMLSVLRATRANPGSDELDELALRRAADGEAGACRQLVECYQTRVFALISRMLAGHPRETVEDLAQDTFLQVFKSLRTFDPAGAARPSTWVLTIAARRSIDELRRKRPLPIAEVIREAGSRADDSARSHEIVRAIETALAELSPELRAAFLLREYHDLEYSEIARALAIDLGTVKSRLARARVALRERLAEVHDE
jgi:RNA polymerase sigma-70 factor (ECF subfamily)